MPRSTKEAQAAGKFVASVSTLDFDKNQFASFLVGCRPQVKRRVLDLFMAFVDALSMKLDENLYTDDEDWVLCIDAKRMQDAMIHFR
jgi:hypothetical protein